MTQHEELKEKLKSFYLNKRQEELPFIKLTDKDEIHFDRAAELCLSLKVNPEVYIEAIMKDQDFKLFFSYKLYPKDTQAKIQQYIKDNTPNFYELFDVQKRYLHDQIVRVGKTVEDSLMDDQVDFDAWFRICITKEPVSEIILKYRKKALIELNYELEKFLKEKKLDVERIKKNEKD